MNFDANNHQNTIIMYSTKKEKKNVDLSKDHFRKLDAQPEKGTCILRGKFDNIDVDIWNKTRQAIMPLSWGIVSKLCFSYWANLGKLINFYSPLNH